MLATKMKSCLLIIVALKISLLESRPVPDLFGMVNSLLGGVGSMLGGAIQSPAGMLGGGAQFPTSMPTMYPSMVAPQQLPQFLSTQYVQGQPVQPLQMQPQSPQSNMNQLEFARQLLSTSDNWNIWKPPQTGLVGAAQQLFLGAENFVSSMLNAFRGLIVGPQPQQYPYPNAFMPPFGQPTANQGPGQGQRPGQGQGQTNNNNNQNQGQPQQPEANEDAA